MKLRVIDAEKVVYSGFFDAKSIYSYTVKFFKSKGYEIKELISIGDFTDYFKRNNIVDVRPEIKLNDYFKLELKINIIYSSVEVINGKTKGKVVVSIEGNVNSDYDNKINYGVFSEIIRTLNDHFFMKKDYDFAVNKLRHDISEFKYFIKEFLNSNVLFRKVL